MLAVESVNTALNLYLTGKADWIYDVPPPALRQILHADPPWPDVNPAPLLNTYFYLINTTRKPLDDVRVRRALSLALDRDEITEMLLGGGERAAYSLVPPGMPGYAPPRVRARKRREAPALLAEAGYPDGRGFPTFTILYNTHEMHQAIAELIRKQWQRNLGITVRTPQRGVRHSAQLAAADGLRHQPPRLDRRLPRPQHVSRHVRHRRRKEQHGLRAIPNTIG